MGGTNHQPGSNGIKDIWKSYKSLFAKQKSNKNRSKKETEEKSKEINRAYDARQTRVPDPEPTNPDKGKAPDDNDDEDEEAFFKRSCSFLSRSSSRRSEAAPSPAKPHIMQKSGSHSATRSSSIKKDLLRSKSTRNDSQTSTFSRSLSSRNLRGSGSVIVEEGDDDKSTGRSVRNSRFSGPTPIVFSHSTEFKIKPPAIERSLECSLEELCHGCVKKINVTRNVVSRTGQSQKEEETLQIKVKPGWKKGTKITFEEKGDSRPGTHPADITFIIHEETHPLFTRIEDDLEVQLEISLLKALTGFSVSVPLLGGEDMDLSLDNVIHPGFEKVIEGQGMPKSTQGGERGDLRVKFVVRFPTELSEEQRKEAYDILKDCC